MGKINPFQIADSFSHSCEIFCGRVTPVIWIDDCLNREWRFCDSCQSFFSFYFMSWRFFPLSQPFLSWLYWHYYIRQNRFDPPPSSKRNQIFSVSVSLMNQRSYLSSRSSWVFFLFLFFSALFPSLHTLTTFLETSRKFVDMLSSLLCARG